jgi:hypothetical protein
MTEFADRIRHARTSAKPVDAPPLPAPGPTLEELEAQRRRVVDLTRKIDELNAAILNEILRHPEGPRGYPLTVAALARNGRP